MLLFWTFIFIGLASTRPNRNALQVRDVGPPEANIFFADDEDTSSEVSSTESEFSTTEDPAVAEARKTEDLIRDAFHIDFVWENGTEIVADRSSIFEVVPLDYLCDFCLAVIEKLKVRKENEENFEENMSKECWAYNGTDKDDGTICELVNKVNLERLKNDEATKICVDEKLCPDIEKEELEKRMREERIRQEDKRREKEKMEEEEKLKAIQDKERISEVKENIKNEGSRLEYEKRIEAEEKKRVEEIKNRIHSKSGDIEYIVDEVDESDKDDYLDLSNKKTDANSGLGEAEGEAIDESQVSGSAVISDKPSGVLFVDRTVSTSLVVDNARS